MYIRLHSLNSYHLESAFASPDSSSSPSGSSDASKNDAASLSSSSESKTVRFSSSSRNCMSETTKKDLRINSSVKISFLTVTSDKSPTSISVASNSLVNSSELSSTQGSDKSKTSRSSGTSSDDIRSSVLHVPEPPTEFCSLLDDSKGDDSFQKQQSYSVNKDGSPTLDSPSHYEEKKNIDDDCSKFEALLSISGDESPLSNDLSMRKSEVSSDSSPPAVVDQDAQENSEAEESEGVMSVHSCSSVWSVGSEEEEEEEGEESSGERSTFINHSAVVSSPVSNRSEAEEESDAQEKEEGGEGFAKSFTTYRSTAAHEDSDSDDGGEDSGADESEGSDSVDGIVFHTNPVSIYDKSHPIVTTKKANVSDVGTLSTKSGFSHTPAGPSLVSLEAAESPSVKSKGVDNSFADSASAHKNVVSSDNEGELYYSCISANTPGETATSPRPPLPDGSGNRDKTHSHSSFTDLVSPVITPPKEDNPPLTNNRDVISPTPSPPESSNEKENLSLASSHTLSHGSTSSYDRVSLDQDRSPPVVLVDDPKPNPQPLPKLLEVIDEPIVPQQQLSKPRSIANTEGPGGEEGATGGGGGGGDTCVVEEKESFKPEPQFKVGYQYRSVVKQLMETQVHLHSRK